MNVYYKEMQLFFCNTFQLTLNTKVLLNDGVDQSFVFVDIGRAMTTECPRLNRHTDHSV